MMKQLGNARRLKKSKVNISRVAIADSVLNVLKSKGRHLGQLFMPMGKKKDKGQTLTFLNEKTSKYR